MFWLSLWLSLLSEPKIRLFYYIFRLVSATAQSELLAQPELSLWLSPKFGLSRG